MHKPSFLAILIIGAAVAVSTAYAAPLDALLATDKKTTPGATEIEASYDLVNDAVDIFNIRANDPDFSGTNVGDYHGAHIRAGIVVTPRLWVDGGFWQRRIEHRQDWARIDSWQIAGQYKLLESFGYRPSMALRLGAWGNTADRLDKTSPTTFQSATVNTVSVAAPRDRQLQLDLIASWPVMDRIELATFGGIGASEVKIGSISGTSTQNGCNYNLAFNRTEVVGTLAEACGGGAVVERFSVPNSVYGVDVFRETQYKANYVHAGFSGKWASGPWQLRGGYQFQVLKRRAIDQIIEQRGGTASKVNHILVGEISYRLTKNTSIFGRGQYMTNQFTGEIPLAYNTFTARRFDKRYGIVSVGLLINLW